MSDLKRNAKNLLCSLLQQFPVVAIVGARQVGKTTLAKQVCNTWKYIDLENPDDFAQISHDPVFFFEQFQEHVIIDEVQEYPQLFNILRGVIDAKRKQKGRFLITGSSSLELLKNLSETLAGRIAIIELGTLKANEFYKMSLSPFYRLFQQKLSKETLISGKPPLSMQQMQARWLHGGYPEPITQNASGFHQRWMANYRDTYINRDIGKLFPKLNRQAYQRFLMMLSNLSGTIINRSELARNIEINEKTVREYLTIANGTFLWRSLSSFERNVTKSIIKMPKGHIRDSGLLHYLLRIENFTDLYQHPIVGKSFEGFVIEEILKGLTDSGIVNWSAHYYRTRNGAEIDLILDGLFGTLPIEIKYGSSVDMRKLSTLTRFIEEHQLPFGMLINQSKEVKWLTSNIIQIPVGWL